MGASNGELKPKVIIKDIDLNQIPMENIKIRELYLIELMTKKTTNNRQSCWRRD